MYVKCWHIVSTVSLFFIIILFWILFAWNCWHHLSMHLRIHLTPGMQRECQVNFFKIHRSKEMERTWVLSDMVELCNSPTLYSANILLYRIINSLTVQVRFSYLHPKASNLTLSTSTGLSELFKVMESFFFFFNLITWVVKWTFLIKKCKQFR